MNIIQTHNTLVETMGAKLRSMGHHVPLTLPAKINRRLTSTKGKCRWHSLKGYRIEYSPILFTAATEAANLNTIQHEICHAFAHAICGKLNHGRTWKRLMVLFTGSAERTYSIDEATFGANAPAVRAASVARKTGRKPRYVINCKCGRLSSCGPIQRKRVLSGAARYRTGCCGTPVTPSTITAQKV